jgi:hypothetical protein
MSLSVAQPLGTIWQGQNCPDNENNRKDPICTSYGTDTQPVLGLVRDIWQGTELHNVNFPCLIHIKTIPEIGISGELGRHSALLEANYVLFIGMHAVRGIRVFG